MESFPLSSIVSVPILVVTWSAFTSVRVTTAQRALWTSPAQPQPQPPHHDDKDRGPDEDIEHEEERTAENGGGSYTVGRTDGGAV